jgi:hypothetical protein
MLKNPLVKKWDMHKKANLKNPRIILGPRLAKNPSKN